MVILLCGLIPVCNPSEPRPYRHWQVCIHLWNTQAMEAITGLHFIFIKLWGSHCIVEKKGSGNKQQFINRHMDAALLSLASCDIIVKALWKRQMWVFPWKLNAIPSILEGDIIFQDGRYCIQLPWKNLFQTTTTSVNTNWCRRLQWLWQELSYLAVVMVLWLRISWKRAS